MSPAPLLLPSAVAIALATGIGVALAKRERAPSPVVAIAAGIVPAGVAHVVLHAPLGDVLVAPLLLVAAVVQIAVTIDLLRRHHRIGWRDAQAEAASSADANVGHRTMSSA